MRTGLLELSKDNQSLARRVMVEAQFLGMQGVIDSVKIAVIRNKTYPPSSDPDDKADLEKFDKEFGSFDAAIRDGVLPASLVQIVLCGDRRGLEAAWAVY